MHLFENNGSVADHNAWRVNFGTALGSGSGFDLGSTRGANLPEPTPIILIAMGAVLIGFNHRRSRT